MFGIGIGFGFGAREHAPERSAEVEVEPRTQHGGQRAVVQRGRGAKAELRPAARLQADERGGEAGEKREHAQVGDDVGALLLPLGRG